MKKNNFHYFIDTTFYFFMCCVPFFVLIAVSFKGGLSEVQNVLSSLTGIFAGTELYNSVFSVIGEGGVAPLLNADTAIFADFICYVVYVTVLHLFIDCLQFIPSLCHKFLDSFGGKDFE